MTPCPKFLESFWILRGRIWCMNFLEAPTKGILSLGCSSAQTADHLLVVQLQPRKLFKPFWVKFLFYRFLATRPVLRCRCVHTRSRIGSTTTIDIFAACRCRHFIYDFVRSLLLSSIFCFGDAQPLEHHVFELDLELKFRPSFAILQNHAHDSPRGAVTLWSNSDFRLLRSPSVLRETTQGIALAGPKRPRHDDAASSNLSVICWFQCVNDAQLCVIGTSGRNTIVHVQWQYTVLLLLHVP